jgi:hypothetical protein
MGRVAGTVIAATGRIRSRRFWRAVHWLLGRRTTVRIADLLLRAASGGDRARRNAALDRARELLVRSGWPGHPPTWVNLDMARLEWRLRRGRPTGGVGRRPPEPPGGEPIRLGILGQLAKLNLGGSPAFVEAASKRFEVVVLDIGHRGRHARYLDRHCLRYEALPADDWLESATAAVEDARLDILHLMEFQSVHGGDVLDRVDTPCVVHYCTGTEPLHDPRVSFQFQDQPEADYFVREDRIFCTMCRGPFSRQVVYDRGTYFDVLDRPEAVPSWREREPLIVFHGSLFKAAAPAYLEAIVGLLRDDPAVRLVLFGKNESFGRTSGTWLDDILSAASRAGVRGRVDYRGEFSIYRSEEGDSRHDAAWLDLRDHLLRARLAPDPWPIGGGTSRAEAYAFGVPGAHMRVRFDESSWGRPQPAAYEIARLLVDEASATGVDGYVDVCRRCLYDEDFADAVTRRQLELLEPTLDFGRYWDDVRRGYETWLAETLR